MDDLGLSSALKEIVRAAVLEALQEHQQALTATAQPAPVASPADEWLSLPAACRRYRASRAHILGLVTTGVLPATTRSARGGRAMSLFRVADLDAVLAPRSQTVVRESA